MLGRRQGTQNTLAFRLASITLSPGFRLKGKTVITLSHSIDSTCNVVKLKKFGYILPY
jgi:hypothetical protein